MVANGSTGLLALILITTCIAVHARTVLDLACSGGNSSVRVTWAADDLAARYVITGDADERTWTTTNSSITLQGVPNNLPYTVSVWAEYAAGAASAASSCTATPPFVLAEPDSESWMVELALSEHEGVVPALGDVNKDGCIDVWVGTQYDGLFFISGFDRLGVDTEPVETSRIHLKPVLVDFDGDDDLDLVVGSYSGTLTVFRNDDPAGLSFTELAGDDNPFDSIDVGSASAPTFGDLDADGDLDLLVGTLTGAIHQFQNEGDGTYSLVSSSALGGLSVRRSVPTLFDFDDDGDLDALVGAYDGTLRSVGNTGSGWDVDADFGSLTTVSLGGMAAPSALAGWGCIIGSRYDGIIYVARALSQWLSAPQDVRVISDVAQLEVSWTSPANDGGLSITGYIVQESTSSDPTLAYITDQATSITVDVLAGQSSSFRVIALTSHANSVSTNWTSSHTSLCALASDCFGNATCSTVYGTCGPLGCVDGTLSADLGETDIDCGGQCGATCLTGDGCVAETDCASFVCASGACAAASCTDGVLNPNSDELDVDCGGHCGVGSCDDGQSCAADTDCASSSCDDNDGVCVSCFDNVHNQGEADVDCGGPCVATCDDGQSCAADSDCASSSCDDDDGVCVSCFDNVHNQGEVDVDCGGPCEATCDDGDACSTDADCSSLWCTILSVCGTPTVPSTVSNLDAAPLDKAVYLSWTLPSDNGREITSVIIVDATETYASVVLEPATEYTWEGLRNGVSINVYIVVQNEIGLSQPSNVELNVIPTAFLVVAFDPVVEVFSAGNTLAITTSDPDAGYEVTVSLVSRAVDYVSVSPSQLNLTAATVLTDVLVTADGAVDTSLTLTVSGPSASEFVIDTTSVAVNPECPDLLDGLLCDGCIALYFRTNDATCEPCPEWAECSGGTEVPQPIAGFFSAAPGIIEECIPSEACLGGYGTDTCRGGYTGSRCSDCVDDLYFRSSGFCEPCPSQPLLRITLVILALATMLITFYYVFQSYPEVATRVIASLGIAMEFFQTASMLAVYDVWPPGTRKLLSVFTLTTFNLELAGVECAGMPFEARWGVVMCLPLLAACIPSAVRLKQALRGGNVGDEEALATAEAVRVSALQFLYLIVTNTTLQVFDCVPQSAGGSVMDIRPSQYCVWGSDTPDDVDADTSLHGKLIAPAVLGLLLYLIGIPLFVGSLVRRFMQELPLAAADEKASPSLVGYRVAFASVRPEMAWWVLVSLLRKLTMASAAVMFSYNTTLTMAVMMLAVVNSWVLHAYMTPYRENAEVQGINRLESVVLGCLYLVLIAGVILASADFQHNWQYDALELTTLTLLIGVTIFVVVETGRQVRRSAELAGVKWKWPPLSQDHAAPPAQQTVEMATVSL